MDRDEVWQAIEAERRGLADLLDTLSLDEWGLPSLCAGWTVRDVAAHLTLSAQTSMLAAVVEIARARGSFNRMIHDTARRKAAIPVEQLVAELRAIAGSRRLAPGAIYLDPLLDVLVHGQDIALPLGRDRAMPREAARVAADRVWTMGFPFRARRALRGIRLTATDVEWSAGEGNEVRGPIDAILLLLTGRPAALTRLDGEGAVDLATRRRRAADAQPGR